MKLLISVLLATFAFGAHAAAKRQYQSFEDASKEAYERGVGIAPSFGIYYKPAYDQRIRTNAQAAALCQRLTPIYADQSQCNACLYGYIEDMNYALYNTDPTNGHAAPVAHDSSPTKLKSAYSCFNTSDDDSDKGASRLSLSQGGQVLNLANYLPQPVMLTSTNVFESSGGGAHFKVSIKPAYVGGITVYLEMKDRRGVSVAGFYCK